MLTTSLPLLPPPASSLLPPLNSHPFSDASHTHDGQNSLQSQQRRTRSHPHASHPRSQLAILTHDERLLSQRKLAIQMYGYSWLKPAGCAKTMLGRREEELEREEVERQLREAELQEQTQAQAEEAHRAAQLDEQRAREARGEDVGEEGERDLDEEVPDMDATDEFGDEGSIEDEDEEDGDVDLDNDVPEGDSGWVYDTTRDPDTESEDEQPISSQLRPPPQSRHSNHLHTQQSPSQDHATANSLYEVHEYTRDFYDDMPNMDEEAPDLDDDVPDADADGGWEHTDTEMEESDMDISIVPPGVVAHHTSMPPPQSNMSQRLHRQNFQQSTASMESDIGSSMRRTSGNVPLSMPPPARPAAASRNPLQAHHSPPNFTPDQAGSDFSVSALISTGNTDQSANRGNLVQQAWLDPASARRNLFGVNRNAPAQPIVSSSRGMSSHPQPQASQRVGGEALRQVSSGGLFTPSPQQQNEQRQQRGVSFNDESQSRTRSGRVISRVRGGRAA
ncbi:hypothetical protein LTR64_004577 [Lithohypha guttulata]|uniref:uncharacterized protein n=1 Tax=Lithohypha guttulata TaxID=1690604 RepID=UPI002DDFFD4F|nr:hypothetical protein LTR51_006125 [Lithohypha guttulata]